MEIMKIQFASGDKYIDIRLIKSPLSAGGYIGRQCIDSMCLNCFNVFAACMVLDDVLDEANMVNEWCDIISDLL